MASDSVRSGPTNYEDSTPEWASDIFAYRSPNKKGDIFLLEEQYENFIATVTKWEMLAATNQMQCENWRQWKKVNENPLRHFLH